MASGTEEGQKESSPDWRAHGAAGGVLSEALSLGGYMAVNHSKAEAAVVVVRLHGDRILCKKTGQAVGTPSEPQWCLRRTSHGTVF